MIELLHKIPERFRSAAYSLPLYLSWIVGISWEEETSGARRAAERSMILTGGFLLLCAILYIISSAFISLLPQFMYGASYGTMILQGLTAIAYIAFSLFLGVREALGSPANIEILDRIARKIRQLFA